MRQARTIHCGVRGNQHLIQARLVSQTSVFCIFDESFISQDAPSARCAEYRLHAGVRGVAASSSTCQSYCMREDCLKCLLLLQDAAGADHWGVRDAAARLVRYICAKFGDPLYNIQPRVSRTLLKALLDRGKPLTTHYGALLGFDVSKSVSRTQTTSRAGHHLSCMHSFGLFHMRVRTASGPLRMPLHVPPVP